MKQLSSPNRLPKIIYYAMLVFVTVIWGMDPIINTRLYRYYSAAALSSLSTLVSALFFFLLSIKKLKLLNKSYIKIALPICTLNSLASLLQRIGLQYTTPAKYAFLEHLSCIVVPLVLFLFLKKKPSLLQWCASLLCLSGCLLLTGVGNEAVRLGIGETLCGSAGILFGICIVATGAYAKKLDIGLFMMIHMFTYFLTSATGTVVLHCIRHNGQPLEAFVFSLNIRHLATGILFGFVSVGLCWLLRNEATRNVNPSAVAVIAPLAAVISAVVSILSGSDKFSASLLISSGMILSAAILSGIAEVRADRKRKTPKRAPLSHN